MIRGYFIKWGVSVSKLNIKKLDKSYKGKKVIFKYQSEYYYDIVYREIDGGFQYNLVKKTFEEPRKKEFVSVLLEDWLENPVLFGAEYNGKIVGFIELSHETWNNRLRVSNIYIEEKYRRKGIGTELMKYAINFAKQNKIRALVLETQSCNHPAISFYMKCGFSIIGFDLSCYSNEDVERREVRIEMGLNI